MNKFWLGNVVIPSSPAPKFFPLLSRRSIGECKVAFQNREGRAGRKIQQTVETVMEVKLYLVCLGSISSRQGQGRKDDEDNAGRGQP